MGVREKSFNEQRRRLAQQQQQEEEEEEEPFLVPDVGNGLLDESSSSLLSHLQSHVYVRMFFFPFLLPRLSFHCSQNQKTDGGCEQDSHGCIKERWVGVFVASGTAKSFFAVSSCVSKTYI